MSLKKGNLLLSLFSNVIRTCKMVIIQLRYKQNKNKTAYFHSSSFYRRPLPLNLFSTVWHHPPHPASGPGNITHNFIHQIFIKFVRTVYLILFVTVLCNEQTPEFPRWKRCFIFVSLDREAQLQTHSKVFNKISQNMPQF